MAQGAATAPARFTQPDTLIPDLYDPQSLNRYSYVRNNPVRNTDPTGHDPRDQWYHAIWAAQNASAPATTGSSQGASGGGDDDGGTGKLIDSGSHGYVRPYVSDLKGLARKLVGESTSGSRDELAKPEAVGLAYKETTIPWKGTLNFSSNDSDSENGVSAAYVATSSYEYEVMIHLRQFGDAKRGFTTVEILELSREAKHDLNREAFIRTREAGVGPLGLDLITDSPGFLLDGTHAVDVFHNQASLGIDRIGTPIPAIVGGVPLGIRCQDIVHKPCIQDIV